ncbi:MFS transporter [Serratia ureilytica]|uniref:MFS transporter n=1 Tax=Serratia ureilytica TaxID=300181 RepID=UPI001E58BB5F|nr:MFS transporter [Serratia ureilytica]
MPHDNNVEIRGFIDNQPFSRYQWLILALCFLAVALDGFDTAIIGFIATSLVQEWGIDKTALGPVMSAALVGLAVGALAAGPLADRIGRKKVLVISLLLFGGFSLLTAFAGSLSTLTLLRFLTGLGLGAAMPNAATLMSEYAPQRCRALMVNLMFCGFPLGSSLGGFSSAWLIPHFGWQSVLVLGGVMPLLLALVLIAARALHGRAWLCRRAHHQGAEAHCADPNDAAAALHVAGRGAGKGSVAAGHDLFASLSAGHVDAVSDLLYGIDDLLSADQLAAAADP